MGVRTRRILPTIWVQMLKGLGGCLPFGEGQAGPEFSRSAADRGVGRGVVFIWRRATLRQPQNRLRTTASEPISNARGAGEYRSGQTGRTVKSAGLRLRWFESSPAHHLSLFQVSRIELVIAGRGRRRPATRE